MGRRILKKHPTTASWQMNTLMLQLSVGGRWSTSGTLFRNRSSIHSALIECSKKKDLQVERIVGIGFGGAATFSGKKSGVQARMKNFAPHAFFVHCHCHMLQLACVQAANSTPGIKQVYTTLTGLWKFFHYSPKRTESLKEVQQFARTKDHQTIRYTLAGT